MRPSQISVGPTSRDRCHQKRQKRRRHQGKKGHVKEEAEVGVTQPQARELLELPAAGKGKEGLPARAFRRSTACRRLDFRLWLPEPGENTFPSF